MSKIIVKKTTHRNFMSYGDNPNEFSFPDGVVLLTAPNGCGKSTIIEVINFALFGTSYRGGNKIDLRNTNNIDAIMEVSMEFTIMHGKDSGDDYRLFRSVNPKGTVKFELEKLTDGKWVPQNKRAGFTQKDFEEKILGFNEVLFKNTIAMNTQESTPFIDMVAAKRRELLESIVAMSTDYWKKESGRLLSAASTACDIAESDISRISNEISNLEGICESLRNERQANIEVLEGQLAEYESQIPELEAKFAAGQGAVLDEQSIIDRFASDLSTEREVDAKISRVRLAAASFSQLGDAEKAMSDAKLMYEAAMSQYSKADQSALETEYANECAKTTAMTRQIMAKNGEIQRAEYSIGRMQSEIDDIIAKGKQLVPGVPCPTCGKLSTAEDIEPHRNELLRQWKQKKDEKEDAEGGLATLREELTALNSDYDGSTARCAEIQSKIDAMKTYYVEKVVPAESAVKTAKSMMDSIGAKIAAAGVDPAGFASELEHLEAEKGRLATVRQQWMDAQQTMVSLQQLLSAGSAELSSARANISRLTDEIDKAKASNPADSLAVAEGRLADARVELGDANARLHEQSDLKAGYSYISKTLCADDGMKKMLFGIFVPAFNKSVQRNLIRAGLPFTMEFDDTMSYRFISAPGLSPKYDMLSQGQKRKVGFAIAMAFRDFVSMVGNFSINLLSLDEVLDISTDDAAMRDMMDLVRTMQPEIGCALVITHRPAVVMDKFDYWVTIENDGMYSSIGEMKKL